MIGLLINYMKTPQRLDVSYRHIGWGSIIMLVSWKKLDHHHVVLQKQIDLISILSLNENLSRFLEGAHLRVL